MARMQASEFSSSQDNNLLQSIARHLRPHKDEIVEKWSTAFKASAQRPPEVSEEALAGYFQWLVGAFVDELENGRFEEYYQQAKAAAVRYAEKGLPYTNLALAVQIQEDTFLSFLDRTYPRTEDLKKASAALQRFSLHLLSVLAQSYFVTSQDIVLRQEAEELAESRRRREQLLAMIVHDFRGPLTSILGFSQLIERALAKGKPCDPKQIEIVAKEARRLSGMVDELADISLIEAARFEVEKQPTDIVTVAREVVGQEALSAPSHHVVLETPDMPIIGEWDPTRLAQALHNLINNAIRTSPEGTDVVVRIELSIGTVTGSVTNQGPGIPPEFLPLVFEPFSRYYREKRIKGMGTSLFVAKGIMEALGGRIWVESEPGKGTKFTFVLPLKGS